MQDLSNFESEKVAIFYDPYLLTPKHLVYVSKPYFHNNLFVLQSIHFYVFLLEKTLFRVGERARKLSTKSLFGLVFSHLVINIPKVGPKVLKQDATGSPRQAKKLQKATKKGGASQSAKKYPRKGGLEGHILPWG